MFVRVTSDGTLSFCRKCLKTYCAVISWDTTDRCFVELQEMPSCAVSRNNTYLPVVVSFSLRTVTYRSSSRASKVTYTLSYRKNIVKLLDDICTFEKLRGWLFKYIEKRKRRCLCWNWISKFARVKRWTIK